MGFHGVADARAVAVLVLVHFGCVSGLPQLEQATFTAQTKGDGAFGRRKVILLGETGSDVLLAKVNDIC